MNETAEVQETKEDIVETDVEQEQEEVKLSPSQQKAANDGWVPEDKWQGDPADWVDHKEFNLRGELMGRINEQSSIINHLQKKVSTRDKALSDMADLQTKIADKAFKDAMQTLKQQKISALEDDDHAAVVEIDEQIDALKENKPKPAQEEAQEQAPQPQTADNTPKEIIDWLSKPTNQWYHKDSTLKMIANGIAADIKTKNPNISPTDLINRMESTLRKELPHRFGRPADVDAGGDYTQSNNTTKKHTWKDLSEDQKRAGDRFEKIGLMTRKEYIDSLEQAGDL